jgi:hypothetical protein
VKPWNQEVFSSSSPRSRRCLGENVSGDFEGWREYVV